jgi:hypothetical protein
MALRNLYDQVNDQYVFSTVDASVLEINNVPISTGGAGAVQNLQQVLSTGADAGNQSLSNVNSINMNGYLNLAGSLGQVHFNTGTNSWQILTSSGSVLLQNYINNSLVSSSFQIDGSGDVFLGSGNNPAPMVYVYGTRGESRVYDTLYNPIPSNPSSAVVYNQNIIVPSMSASSAVVNNSNISSHILLLKTFPVNTYSGASHYVLTINSITASLSNFESSNFYLDFALVSNRNGNVSAVTQSDINKNFSIPRFTQPSYTQNTTFTISDIQIEFFDNSGINDLMLVCYSFGLSASNIFNVSSMDMNVRCDNLATYNDLPNITT